MRPHRPLGWLALLGALLVLSLTARKAAALEPPSRVSVLTMGPGAHPFTRFGHNAILLEWDGAEAKRDAVYNFGTFEFEGVKGVADFMAGHFRYWLSVSTLQRTVRSYAADQRSLVAQELALTVDERARLAEALAKNVLPEHRYYDYDYYRDNCSTRVRDVLDRVLGGQLRRSVEGPGRLSFRQHTLRLVGDSPWLYAGLDIALGSPTDRPTTRWEELFLPRELHDALSKTRRELGGQSVPLVTSERRLLESRRVGAPEMPPERRPAFAAVGAVLGVGLALLGRAAARRRAFRVTLGVVVGLLGTCLGVLGCVFAGFWLFSKHWAAHRNLSLLLFPPWALALGIVGVALALGRPRAPRQLYHSLIVLLATSVAALVVAITPGGDGEAQRLVFLVLPVWAGLILGVSKSEARARARG